MNEYESVYKDIIVELHYLHDEYSDDNLVPERLHVLTWHRIGGPAYIDFKTHCAWFVRDKEYDRVHEYCEACKFDGATTLMWVLKYGERLPRIIEEL